MTLEELGYTTDLKNYRNENQLDSFGIGRVASEHKDRYIVKTEWADLESELIGNLRFAAENRNDLPAVGDWVAISEYDENKALIHAVLPRKSIIERKAVGQASQTQIIATNIDFGLIVQSVNRDFSINRLERYLTICNASKIKPIIVLSKADLVSAVELKELFNKVRDRIKDAPIYAISNETRFGVDELQTEFSKGLTYCLLGSSGVGKSTLLNTLIGIQVMETGEISEAIDRGKHVTSHRELIVFEKGILIDNPGMREVGIANVADGLEMTFDDIMRLSEECKFSDCAHVNEKGCAVLAAIETGDLDEASYENFMKMEREKMHFESDAQERKKKDKDLGKLIKSVKKQRRNNKY